MKISIRKSKIITLVIILILIVLVLVLAKSCEKEITPSLHDGTIVSENNYPYQIAIIAKSQPKKAMCGGVILNSEWILTAAHCLYGKNYDSYKIYSGDIVLNADGKLNSIKQVFEYDHYNPKTQKNEKYNHSSYANDLALIQLNKPLEFNTTTEAIAYISPYDLDQLLKSKETVMMLGWYKKNIFTNDKLSEKIAPLVDESTCKKDIKMAHLISNGMICLGEKGITSACKGDSGGGVFYLSEDGYKLLGIIAMGSNDCNPENKKIDYDVLMSVFYYQEWVTAIINKHSKHDNFSFIN